MTATDPGTWDPLPLSDIVTLFEEADFRWWIAGGNALELHEGRSWRHHDDVDVGVLRSDARRIHRWLSTAGWDLWLAAAGRLTPWGGSALDSERSHNNIWVRTRTGEPWNLDLTVGDGDDTRWRYRRDPAIAREWHAAVLVTSTGIPYLAPELQLLFKSKAPRPKDHADAWNVAPGLSDDRRAFLRNALPADHPWRALVT